MRSTRPISVASVARLLTTVSIFASAVPAVASSFRSDDYAFLLPRQGASTVGCFSSSSGLTSVGPWNYQSQSYCTAECAKINKPVAATSFKDCLCGDAVPDGETDGSNCNTPCPGFGSATCGGNGYWTVYLTGVGSVSSSSSSSPSSSSTSSSSSTDSSSTTSGPATVVTDEVSGGQTIIVTTTASADTSNSSSSSGGGSSTAGIAAGVVVGVFALAAIAGGVFFFLRHKKRKEAAEAYQQQTQVAEFMRGARNPQSSYSGLSDQRLDPEAGQRNSVGSLADNEDYSRRILRVANPDHS